MTTELDARILIRIPMATLVISQTWIDTIVDYASNEIEVYGRTHGRTDKYIEALADAMRALKNPTPTTIFFPGYRIFQGLLKCSWTVRAKITICLKSRNYQNPFWHILETLNKNYEAKNCNDMFIQFRFIVSQSLLQTLGQISLVRISHRPKKNTMHKKDHH